MKEIGGYFGFEQLVSNEYHKGLVRLNTARNALLYLLKSKKIDKLYIPYYLCDSVSNALKKNGFKFEYYNINRDFSPMFDINLKEDEYIYLVNYYGQLSNEKILLLKNKFKKVILDNTHAFFLKPLDNIDTIYSCRKFFGVPDGAYLSTNGILNEELEVDKSRNRMTHLLGRFEGSASEYYINFQEVDEVFNTEPLKFMSLITHNILGAIDYENVFKIRNKNYAFLESKLKEMNKLNLSSPSGAFAYPIYIQNGIQIRQELAKKKIYIPTLWPNVLENTLQESIEHQYAANILPIPCDQRYGTEDMEYIIDIILKISFKYK